MADPTSTLDERLQSPSTGPIHSFPEIRQPVRRYTSSSNGTYSPLPPGRWTLDIHGNCPRCHHHHNSVQVKVKVTPDVSHVSHVHCEKCNETWAAFGGRNTTRISLLSVASTEPNPVEMEIRYRFIDVVKAAMKAASLEPLAEQSTHVSSVHLSPQSHTSGGAHASASFPRPSNPATNIDSVPSVEIVRSAPTIHSAKNRHPRRLISKVKDKVTARFPMLHRANLMKIIGVSRQSTKPNRQFEKSPVHTPPAGDPHAIEAGQPLAEGTCNGLADHEIFQPSIPNINANDCPPSRPFFDTDATGPSPSGRLAEVATFFASLDQSALKSMNEQERVEWMRKQYTSFKARSRKLRTPRSISAVLHTSNRSNSPHLQLLSNRDSLDVFGALGGQDDFDFRDGESWRSISISDRTSEANTACDARSVRWSRDSTLQSSQSEVSQHSISGTSSQHTLTQEAYRSREFLIPPSQT
ncbi:hypothetical protein GQ44DRAFT_769677 [Phaeosphaeriaceae sp. PMI808]|nr:hypothetical protein GQ44DRAFT_769677 [Phaeosphaeriaceae sp. PMI808]